MLNEITKVHVDGREILLLGTAHVSKKSVELVERTIKDEKPDIVAVELCQDRYNALINKKRWDETEITKVIKEGKTNLFLMQLLLTNFQRKIGDELGVKPGSEMIQAIELAKKENLRIEFVDRSINITLKRAFNLMSFKEKFKLLYSFVSGIFGTEEITEETIEKMKETDIVTELMNDLGKEIPSVKKVLVDERDEYIAKKILNLKGKKILAVIGAGHVQGIKKRLETKKFEDSIEELEKIPKKKSFFKYFVYGFTILFVALIFWSFYSLGLNVTLDLILKWILISGTLSAVGVALAFGHPFSMITAFFAAPFTSLHPALAVGWFAGLVEMWVRKPKVKDFDGLMKINGLRDLWKNQITRILLVIAFANIGCTIGNLIAGAMIINVLHQSIVSAFEGIMHLILP